MTFSLPTWILFKTSLLTLLGVYPVLYIYNQPTHNQSTTSQNILIIRRQNILLHRPCHSLECLMRLALVIVVLHILHRGKRRLDGDVEPLVARVVDGLAYCSGEDVGFAVLQKREVS